MKPSTVLLSMIGLAVTQHLTDSIPTCAVNCLEKGVASATDCDIDDNECLCEVDNYRNTYSAAQACVLQACGADKSLEEVLPSAAAFCSSVTGGATAPPVDDSASATVTSMVSQATTAADASATTGTASKSSASGSAAVTSSGAAATTTASTDGAAAMGSIGGLGMIALGALAAF